MIGLMARERYRRVSNMFKDYKHIQLLTPNEHALWRHQFRIYDDDFEAVVEGVSGSGVNGKSPGAAIDDAIITCYTERNLPVAPNLFRFFLLFAKKSPYVWTIDKQVKWNKEHNPRWPLVEKEMQMYLLFS
jgi:hypothetical protein